MTWITEEAYVVLRVLYVETSNHKWKKWRR